MESLLDDELLKVLNDAMTLKVDTEFIEIIKHEINSRELKIEFSVIEEKYIYLVSFAE